MTPARSTTPAAASRIHIGLETAELARSILFYRVLLGGDPVKVRPGYAKFEPADPSVNLSLSEGPGERPRPGSGRHFGIEVRSVSAVDAMIERLRRAGIAVRVERAVECCYAVQDKVWAEDPDGNPWEVFVVLQPDAARRAPQDATCCVPAAGDAGPCCGGV
jgi:catechol 2,3-dioxygenase-like lactoylglutathione lyase family enzyme